MTKTFKKPVSILLAVIMILSVFTIVPMSASAAGNVASVNGVEYATFAEAVAASHANNEAVITPLVNLNDLPQPVYTMSVGETLKVKYVGSYNTYPAAPAGYHVNAPYANDSSLGAYVFTCTVAEDIVKVPRTSLNATTGDYFDYYTQLQSNISGTQYVCKDFTQTTRLTFSKAYPVINAVIDLGGHTVTFAQAANDADSIYGHYNANITIQNGTIVFTTDDGFYLDNANLTVAADATLSGTGSNSPIVVKGGSTVDVNGTVTAEDSFAIAGNGNSGNGGYTININDGAEVTSTDGIAIYHPNEGDLNISGGTISGKTAVYVKSGNTTITGGTFTATGAAASVGTGSGATPTGDAIVVDNAGYTGGAPEVTISNGTFQSANADAIGSYDKDTTDDSEAEIAVSGGTFSSEVPAEYCAPGFSPVDDGSGNYGVTPKDYVAQVGDDKYEDIAEAINAAIGVDAENCGTVYLLKAFSSTITFTPASAGVFKVYGNGYTGLSKITYPASIIQNPATPYTMSYTGNSTSASATRTYTIAPATVEVERADGTKVYPNALYQALAGTVGGGRAQGGDTVRLLTGIDLTDKATIKVTDSNVTIDLGDHEITGAKEGFIEVKAGNTLNIENGTIVGDGTIKVGAGSTLALDGAVVSAPVTAGAEATMTFENGAGLTGDITVPAGYEVVVNETTGAKTVQPSADLAPKHSISLEGNVELNFYLNPTLVGAGDTVNFTWDGEIEKNVNYELTAADLDASTGYYKASVSLPAAEMTCDVTATVEKNNETLTDTYSVRDYCNVILSDSYANSYQAPAGKPWQTYEKLSNLVKSMLDYGAKAQVAFGKNTTNLANNGIDYDMASFGQYDIDTALWNANGNNNHPDLEQEAFNFSAHYFTSSLIYLSDSTLRIYFTPDVDGFNIAYPGDYDGNKEEYYYYVQKENIPAAELDNRQEFTIGEHTFYYSPLDYVNAVLDNSNMTEQQKDLARATYWYNHYANLFFDQPQNQG